MIIVFPNGSVVDTTAGAVVFDAGAADIKLNAQTVYVPATAAEWNYLQMVVTRAARQNLSQLNLGSPTPPIITSISPTAPVYTGGSYVSMFGSGFKPSSSLWVSYPGLSGSALPAAPCLFIYQSEQAGLFILPNLGNNFTTATITLFNPDGGLANFTFSVT